MIVSHSAGFILLAPWKCASSTCHARLQSYDQSQYRRYFEFNPRLNRVVHQHLTLDHLAALPEWHLGYKMAAFVRNPYDRAYSGFLQIQRDFNEQPRIELEDQWVAAMIRAQVALNMDRVIKAGFQFDEWIHLLPDYEVYDAAHNTNMPLHPAHYWTHVGGEQKVHFVGKVERFEEDFIKFCESVGIEVPSTVNANCTSGELTADRPFKYTERMARRSIDRINELFEKDFEYFAYEML